MDQLQLINNAPDTVDDHVTICLKNTQPGGGAGAGADTLFHFQASFLKANAPYLAQLIVHSSIHIHCSPTDFNHFAHVLTRLDYPPDSLLDSWTSVTSTIAILQAALSLHCLVVAQSCVDYLEAVPWDDKEEDEILRLVPKLGPLAMPILARVQPVDPDSTKNVFLAAVRYAMSISDPDPDPDCPPFEDEIRISAQEQIEYMIGEDDDTPLVIADEQVSSEAKRGVCQMFSMFNSELSTLLTQSDVPSENNILGNLRGFEWLCNVLPKMNLMREFVLKWAEVSTSIVSVVEQPQVQSTLWRMKLKVIEITSKVFDAVGCGSVIVASTTKVELLKIWLPYIQKMKPVFDSLGGDDDYKMEEELCQSIQGAIVSMLVTLPSNDQAEILADWMESQSQRLGYPDLTEAFEIWCYRTKSSKRRLVDGLDRVSNGSLSSDLSA